MAAPQAEHQPGDHGRGEALRPRQQGSAALQEYVDAGTGAMDVRPRPPAADRLAEGEVRQGARTRRRKYRGAERRSCLRRDRRAVRSEEHTSELQSLMRISYAVFCLKKKNITKTWIH